MDLGAMYVLRKIIQRLLDVFFSALSADYKTILAILFFKS
jgi:hypothetical protein